MSNDAQPTVPIPRVHESGDLVYFADGQAIPEGFSPSPTGDFNWANERRLRACPNLAEHDKLYGPCLLCNGTNVMTPERWRMAYAYLYHWMRRGLELPA